MSSIKEKKVLINNSDNAQMDSKVRVQLDFSRDAIERLDDMLRKTDANSRAEVIRDAFASEAKPFVDLRIFEQ